MSLETTFGLLSSPAISVVRGAEIPYKPEHIGQSPIDIKNIDWSTQDDISKAVKVYTASKPEDAKEDSTVFNVIITSTVSNLEHTLAEEFMNTYEESALQKGVERGFWDSLEGTNATEAGKKSKTKVAFAQLENVYSDNSSGLSGVIHSPRGFADIYKGKIEGKNLLSHVGTPVIAGAGYVSTSNKIYETGPVEVLISEPLSFTETNTKDNTTVFIKEYTVVVSYMDGPISTEIDLTLE